ncbi:MAG: peptide chain release factor-like protein [Candidatus Omnitrophica bacterium]|nr:peptide chain release factor-like protein [Candidatus Omnitrophota bacterium]
MNIFNVGQEKVDALAARMARLGIREADLQEQFVRSGGPGGQNVNKVATCVYLKHLPSGMEVKVQQERSQALNRFLARRLLCQRMETLILGRKSEERKRIYRIRRQKQKRSKRAKEKMLRQKKLQSLKKQLRRKPDGEE